MQYIPLDSVHILKCLNDIKIQSSGSGEDFTLFLIMYEKWGYSVYKVIPCVYESWPCVLNVTSATRRCSSISSATIRKE